MAVVNHAKKEINAKIVYYGPTGSGKKTALTYIYSRIKPSLRGDLKSVPAGADKLLFFDFSPFETPLPNGYRVRLHVYTLSGIVTNPATWKMTLKGTDGIIIMVDPSVELAIETNESVSQLRNFLSAYGVGLNKTPAVLQLNDFTNGYWKDHTTAVAADLDLSTLTTCCSNAASGEGLLEALTELSRQILDRINQHDDQPDTTGDPVLTVDVNTTGSAVTFDPLKESRQPKVSAEQPPVVKPIVTLLSKDIFVDGAILKIPMEVQYGSSQSKLVVSISVAAES
jgi:signal recognition particle receptor subunit beta